MTRSDLPVRAYPDELPSRSLAPCRTCPMRWCWAGAISAAPIFGLVFSAFYVLGGWALASVAFASGRDWLLIPFILGFPLIASFAAVGLYEVSRRIEAASAWCSNNASARSRPCQW